jgi:hypothetical protein
MMIYLLILNDEPLEILSAWSTYALAETEQQRLLDARVVEVGRQADWYWLEHRLEIRPMHVDYSDLKPI